MNATGQFRKNVNQGVKISKWVCLVYTQIHHFEAKQMKVHIPQFLTQYHKQVTRYGCFYVIAIATDYDRSFMLF